MTNQENNSLDRFARRYFAGRGLRSGVAKDKLVFIIICSAALLVAAVTLVMFFTGTSRRGIRSTSWQCLKCGDEFTKKTSQYPPIECPTCGGEAVRLVYRECPNCGVKVLCNRVRLSEQGQARLAAILEQQAKTDGAPVPQDSGRTPGMMPVFDLDTQMQYRVKQADGSYAWTDWVAAMSSPQQAMQLRSSMRCPECDALVFAPSQRRRRSGN